MIENVDDKILKNIDPNGIYLWKWISSRGKSGGLLSGINIDLLDVGSFCEGKFILQMDLWDKQLTQKWNFLNIYGAAQEVDKNEFLAEIARFCSNNKKSLFSWWGLQYHKICFGEKQAHWSSQAH